MSAILALKMNALTIRQLEMVIWSCTQREDTFKDYEEVDEKKMLLNQILKMIKEKCVSMNAKGLSHIITSVMNI